MDRSKIQRVLEEELYMDKFRLMDSHLENYQTENWEKVNHETACTQVPSLKFLASEIEQETNLRSL